MLQGKPALILGSERMGIAVPARAKTPSGAKDSPGPDFASFLPKTAETPARSRPTPAPPADGAEETGLPAGRSFFTPGNAAPSAGFAGRLGKIPEILQAGVSRALQPLLSGGNRTEAVEVRQRGPASASLRAGTEAGRTEITAYSRRTGQGDRERLSGRPIPRWGKIGMEDTRKKREAASGGSVPAVSSGGAVPSSGKPSLPREAEAASWMSLSFGQEYSLRSSSPAGMAIGGVRSALAGSAEQAEDLLPSLRALPGGRAVRPVELPAKGEARPGELSAREKRAAPSAAEGEEPPQPSSRSPSFAGSPLIQAVWRLGSGIRKDLGSLAAKFESGTEGIAAIGYDRHGGTSYGKFQIASRVGTMGRFIRYLEAKAPDLAARLASSGPANTGGRAGKMPAAWKGIAGEDPQRFERLQNDFIRESHYEPALRQLGERTGISFDALPAALQEVVFSTAVQHGPGGAFRIVSRALDRVGEGRFSSALDSPDTFRQVGEELIKHVYAIRAGQFTSSSRQIQAAARERLRLEMREALSLLA